MRRIPSILLCCFLAASLPFEENDTRGYGNIQRRDLSGHRNPHQHIAVLANLFVQAMSLGWDKEKGGFFYTLDWDDKPAKTNKLWWPMCEGAAAAHFINQHLPADSFYEDSYRLIWGTIANKFVDHRNGGWHEELTEELEPAYTLFEGKGDIYHALQACLIPLYPATGSLTRGILEEQARIHS